MFQPYFYAAKGVKNNKKINKYIYIDYSSLKWFFLGSNPFPPPKK
jgi:hypothetical protein